MTKTEAIDLLDNLVGMVEDNQENDYDEALKMAIEALRTIEKQQHDGCLNCDHFDVVRQIQWERDTAIQQLKELGYGLGEKIRTDGDTISRQSAIDAPKRFTKDCNPENFVGHSNFIEYMDTVGIQSFGNWQYANGFNMGLTAAEVAIEKLPSTQRKGKWIEFDNSHCECPFCHSEWDYFENMVEYFKFCPNCGAEMKGESGEESL